VDSRAALTAAGPLAAVLCCLAACIAWASPAPPEPDPRTPAEVAAAVAVTDARYPELDIRRYGAICDYDESAETDGQPPRSATDNLPAFQAAIAVAAKRGGGTVRVDTGGDCYVSNTINARGIDGLWFHVATGTTVRATRYTSGGTLFALGNSAANPSVRDVGISGGGAVRTFRPEHDKLPAYRPGVEYARGSYVLSTDSNGEKRAYYAKRGGIASAATAPDAINGADADGTVVWQDADNDNVISLSGIGASAIGMKIPAASGKSITVQTPRWSNVLIKDNIMGVTNDKAIEVKGQQGLPGQQDASGYGVRIVGNVIETAGREGIEIEQSAHGRAPNRDCRVVGNIVRSAGIVNGASGIRINRCDGVEIRGNRVLRAAGNGYHLRLARNVVGDLHAENVGQAGVHLQQVAGFDFDDIYVSQAARGGVLESNCSLGGRIGKLVVESSPGGYRAAGRKGPPPRVETYEFESLTGPGFAGTRPALSPAAARPED